MKYQKHILKIKKLFIHLVIWLFGYLVIPCFPVFAAVDNGGGGGDNGTSIGTLKGLPGGFDPGTDPGPEGGAEMLTKIFSNVFGVMTLVGGLMFIVYFLLGSIQWVTSSGDREKVEKAKKQMTNAAIGLIIVVASYGIAFIIGTVLGIDILNPGEYIIKNLGPGVESSD